MKLWVIAQSENDDYDTYDSAVVAAETADEARKIHPHGSDGPSLWKSYGTWATSPEAVIVELIGEALPDTKPGVILASFNAG